jgi:hypothetical protein
LTNYHQVSINSVEKQLWERIDSVIKAEREKGPDLEPAEGNLLIVSYRLKTVSAISFDPEGKFFLARAAYIAQHCNGCK